MGDRWQLDDDDIDNRQSAGWTDEDIDEYQEEMALEEEQSREFMGDDEFDAMVDEVENEMIGDD